jgi:hypothetical protein
MSEFMVRWNPSTKILERCNIHLWAAGEEVDNWKVCYWITLTRMLDFNHSNMRELCHYTDDGTRMLGFNPATGRESQKYPELTQFLSKKEHTFQQGLAQFSVLFR